MRTQPHVQQTSEALDILDYVVDEARRDLELRRVLLFGSRARGDARSGSDIDLAFEHESDDATWAGFVNRMRDTAPTLLDLDLIDLDSVSPELRSKVLAEGKVLYG